LDEQREIAELYADGKTPMSEIRERFAISDPSIYRVLKQQGVPSRGRLPSRGAESSSADNAGVKTSSKSRHFRVHFDGEFIVYAADVSEALRKAEQLGQSSITVVERIDDSVATEARPVRPRRRVRNAVA
jgi:hypothetical protein